MKCTYLGFNPNLGEEFMERHGGGFILGLPKTPTGTPDGVPSQPDSLDPNAPETEEDSIRAGIQRMLKVIHDEKVGRLRSIDSALSEADQDRLRKEIHEHAERRRSKVLQMLSRAGARESEQDMSSDVCPQNVRDLSAPDAVKDD